MIALGMVYISVLIGGLVFAHPRDRAYLFWAWFVVVGLSILATRT
jgi:hypothetical protein